jgi:formylglycine-generating enzyme required for sulfatase activity
LFDSTSQKNKSKGASVLRVTSVPASATVRLLNVRDKYTEKGLELPAGAYNVEVLGPPGYWNKSQWVELPAGEDFELTVNLVRRNAAEETTETESRAEGESKLKVKKGAEVPVANITQGAGGKSQGNGGSVQPVSHKDFQFVEIKKGSFVMGGERYNEGPVHAEQIQEDFFIMDAEVSVQQYAEYAKATGASLSVVVNKEPDFPVVNVSWQDAVDYAQWLSKKTGQNYRLPTEAEWEYVARKGLLSGVNSNGTLESSKGVVAVRMSSRNTLDIYGMPGNVWEWCLDCWSQRYENKENNQPSDIAACGSRVIRGGSWRDPPKLISVTSRNGVAPATKANNIGFRLVRKQ